MLPRWASLLLGFTAARNVAADVGTCQSVQELHPIPKGTHDVCPGTFVADAKGCEAAGGKIQNQTVCARSCLAKCAEVSSCTGWFITSAGCQVHQGVYPPYLWDSAAQSCQTATQTQTVLDGAWVMRGGIEVLHQDHLQWCGQPAGSLTVLDDKYKASRGANFCMEACYADRNCLVWQFGPKGCAVGPSTLGCVESKATMLADHKDQVISRTCSEPEKPIDWNFWGKVISAGVAALVSLSFIVGCWVHHCKDKCGPEEKHSRTLTIAPLNLPPPGAEGCLDTANRHVHQVVHNAYGVVPMVAPYPHAHGYAPVHEGHLGHGMHAWPQAPHPGMYHPSMQHPSSHPDMMHPDSPHQAFGSFTRQASERHEMNSMHPHLR